MAQLGRNRLQKRDGRTSSARLARQIVSDLSAHVGKPSATQRVLIAQIAEIQVRLAHADKLFAETGAMTDLDTKTYLSWASLSARLLNRLGLKSAAPERPASTSLADHVAKAAKTAENVPAS